MKLRLFGTLGTSAIVLAACSSRPTDGNVGGESQAATIDIHDNVILADFDGDKRTDFLQSMGTGPGYYVDLASTGFGNMDGRYIWNIAANIVSTADFDGDGRPDMAMMTLDGWILIDLAANGFLTGTQSWPGFDLAVWRPYVGDLVAADYDGDGCADIAVKYSSGAWDFDFASNAHACRRGAPLDFGDTWDLELSAGYGDVTALPVPADYDGDGATDLAVKNSRGEWNIDYACNSHRCARPLVPQFGAFDEFHQHYGDATAHPAVADYDGDGRADLAIKADDGEWNVDYACNSHACGAGGITPQFGAFDEFHQNYGGSDLPPVPADLDGDGKADMAVYDRYYKFILVDAAKDGFHGWNYDQTRYLSFCGDAQCVLTESKATCPVDCK